MVELLTLDALVRQGPLAQGDVASIIDDVLGAVVEVHARGGIDRAVGPHRVVLHRDEGRLRASLRQPDPDPIPMHRGEPDLAQYSSSIGRFAFMAPEQVRGSSDVDARADVYAVGALAFYALTRTLPFEGTNALVLIAKKLDRMPPTLERVVGRSFSSLLELFVATSMSIDRNQRYPRASAAREAWRNAIGRSAPLLS